MSESPYLSAQELVRFELRTLLYLAGELPPDELPSFNEELATHRSLRAAFVGSCILSGLLIEYQLTHQLSEPRPSPNAASDMTVRGQHFTFEDERNVSQVEAIDPPEAPAEHSKLSASPTHQEPAPPRSGWRTKVFGRLSWRVAAAILLPLTLALTVWMVSRPAGSSATLATSVNAQWDSAEVEPRAGERLPAKTLSITSGLVGINLASGASIVVQGPAKFRVGGGNAVDLDAGRLTAMVPVAAHGFSVRTPSAIVVDLGTDFGVSVDANGGTAVSVFQGRIELTRRDAANETGTAAASTTLTAGQAATVADGVLTLSADGATPQAFVRSLTSPPTIDVVDLICGGDGTTHRRSGGIDPRTGDAGLLIPVGNVSASDGEYHAVPRLGVIDGCFVPNGITKSDSANHTFDFGNTMCGSFYDIRAGGIFAWPLDGEKFTSILGGIDYAASGHGLILMHPNCGITFDLAALRRLHPGLNISVFRAAVGNSYSGPPSFVSKADVYVLVDGVPRFERQRITEKDGRIDLNIPLKDSDGFLTIATTNHEKIAMHEWLMFGDPRLE